jgi:hypothetical protein
MLSALDSFLFWNLYDKDDSLVEKFTNITTNENKNDIKYMSKGI